MTGKETSPEEEAGVDLQVICECGETMVCNQFDPDQDETFIGFDCACGASFYGTFKRGAEEEEEEEG